MSKRGRFITVEGQDGAGKSSNLARIERLVGDAGYPVLRTREPGGTPLGEALRELVLHRRDLDMTPLAELLLIFAARAEHLEAVIRPALEAGTWVLCDRFTDATHAYQGGGRGVAPEAIAALEAHIQAGLDPDLTLLFDLDCATGARRASGRGPQDRFESEAQAFRQRVREAYLARARDAAQRIRVVDAGGNRDAVGRAVDAELRRFLASLPA